MPIQKTRAANLDQVLPTVADEATSMSLNGESSEMQSPAETVTNESQDVDDVVAETKSDLPDNSLERILLREGDSFSVHSAAARFRKLESHRERLRQSLRQHGQLEDAVVRRLPGGTFELLDGVTRQEELFRMGEPLACQVIREAELEGRSIEDFIMKVNLHNGRDLSDAQRTVAAMDVYANQIVKWSEEAAKRQATGKAVNASDKFDMVDFLAQRVNVSKNKMEKILQLRKESSGTELLQAVWEGIPVSTALRIAHERDATKRGVLVAIATSGDKARLKIAMTESTTKRANDRFGVTVPPSLLDSFEQTAAAEAAISQAEQAAEKLRGTKASSKFIDDASHLRTDVLPALAYAMCEWCEWSGRVGDTACPACKGKRYLTLAEFEEAKEREKAKFVVTSK